MKHYNRALLFGALVSIAGCSVPSGTFSDTTYTVCTQDFRTSTVTVLDQSNALVGNASVLVTVPRTGDTLTIQSLALWATGVYPIVDDGSKGKLRADGDTVRVAVSSSKGSALASYVFTVPSGCHIYKVSGPDTLKVQ